MATKTVRHFFVRLSLSLLFTIAAVFLLLLFFFRGPFLATPLAQLLTNELGHDVTIKKVEYNILYPGTIAIYDLNIKDICRSQTTYLEFDLWSYLTGQTKRLELVELDLIDPVFKDLPFIEAQTAQLPNLIGPIRKVWLKNLSSENFKGLELKTSNFDLHSPFSKNLLSNYSTINLHLAQVWHRNIESGQIELDCHHNVCLAQANLNFDGGNLTTTATINQLDRTIHLSKTNISNHVLSTEYFQIPDWTTNLESIQAQTVDLKLPPTLCGENCEIAGFSGLINLSGTTYELSGDFATMAIRELALTAGNIKWLANGSFNVSGTIGEHGQIVTNGVFLPTEKLLKFNEIKLNQVSATLEPSDFSNLFNENFPNLAIEHFTCYKCEILSGFDNFNFFTRQSDIELSNFEYTEDPAKTTTRQIFPAFSFAQLAITHGDLGLLGQRFWNPRLTGSWTPQNFSFNLIYNEDSTINVAASLLPNSQASASLVPPSELNFKDHNFTSPQNNSLEAYQVKVVAQGLNPSHFIISNSPKIYGDLDVAFTGTAKFNSPWPATPIFTGELSINGPNLALDGYNLKRRLTNLVKNRNFTQVGQIFAVDNSEVDEFRGFFLHANIEHNAFKTADFKTMALEGNLSAVLSTTTAPEMTDLSLVYHDLLEDNDHSYLVAIDPNSAIAKIDEVTKAGWSHLIMPPLKSTNSKETSSENSKQHIIDDKQPQ